MQLATTNYIDNASEIAFTDLQKELIGFAEVQGKQNGAHNKPANDQEWRAYIVNYIESKIQQAIHENHQSLTPVSPMVVAKQLQVETKDKVDALTIKIEEDEHKLRPLEEKRKQYLPDLQTRIVRKLVYIGAGLISLAESYFAYESFRNIPIPKLPALVAATAIGVAVGFSIHILGGYIQKAQSGLQKLYRFLIVLLPAFIGFFYLGTLRANAYNTMHHLHQAIGGEATQTTPSISNYALTIISFILFVTALLFSVKYHKTKDESLRDQQFDLITEEIDKLEQQIQQRQDEILQLESECNEKAAAALRRYEYAIANENKLISLARQALEVYKEKNLRHRTDGLCPLFFSQPPVLHFQKFFDNLKKT